MTIYPVECGELHKGSHVGRRPSPYQRLCAAEDDDLLIARDIRAMIICIFTLVSSVNQVTTHVHGCIIVFFHVLFLACLLVSQCTKTWLTAKQKRIVFKSV